MTKIMQNGVDVTDLPNLAEALVRAGQMENPPLLNQAQEYGQKFEPAPEGTPEAGVVAYINISKCGEVLASFLEHLGAQAVIEAESYKARCVQVAEQLREDYKAEARRAASYTTKMKDMAEALSAVVKRHD